LQGLFGRRAALATPAFYQQHGMHSMHRAPESDCVLEELELAPHGDNTHLKNLWARLCEPLEVGGTQAQLVQQQHLQVGR
jgi:hypothetical protein